MARKNSRNTKGKIIQAAWKLFYEHGYEETTIEDIVFESGTSKGSFYHYFAGKDALMSTLADLFDEKYASLQDELEKQPGSLSRLIYLNHEMFAMIDSGVSVELVSRLLSTQLTAKGEKHLLDRDRLYFRLLRKIIIEGQKKGELTTKISAETILHDYAMWERALMYDWCLNGAAYELTQYTDRVTPGFLRQYLAAGTQGTQEEEH